MRAHHLGVPPGPKVVVNEDGHARGSRGLDLRPAAPIDHGPLVALGLVNALDLEIADVRIGRAAGVVVAHLNQRNAAPADAAKAQAIDGDPAELQAVVVEASIERLAARAGN